MTPTTDGREPIEEAAWCRERAGRRAVTVAVATTVMSPANRANSASQTELSLSDADDDHRCDNQDAPGCTTTRRGRRDGH